MLQHDYIMEIIQQFVNSISASLKRALVQHDEAAAQEVEQAVGELLELDPQTAMALSPESLVTMMQLAGTGDAVSGYVAFALNQLGIAYEGMGESELADARHAQALAVAEAFGGSVDAIPEELQGYLPEQA